MEPRFGNMLGGTPVLISGLCQDPESNENITSRACMFEGGGREIDGYRISSNTMVCFVPRLRKPGIIVVTAIVKFSVQDSDGKLRPEDRIGQAPFTVGKLCN